jgi:hypothetical protein
MKAMMILVWFKNTLDISKHMDEIRNEEDLVKAMPEADLSNIWSKKLLFCFVVVVSEQLCGSSVVSTTRKTTIRTSSSLFIIRVRYCKTWASTRTFLIL